MKAKNGCSNKTGEQAMAASNGRLIVDTIITGAIPFIEKQPMAIVSSTDADGNVWASLLIGDFGFVTVPGPSTVHFNQEMIFSCQEDIFYNNLSLHPHMGSLFIEFATRRRYRVNGTCTQNKTQLDLKVLEAYPNCPKYIQRRVVSASQHFSATVPIIEKGTQLPTWLKDWIEKADTFFVGSQSREGNMDVSHRGGNPGFLRLLENEVIKIPDYPGNSLFNTFGNLVQNPNAGLLFIDFENGQTLQLTGKAELLLNQHLPADMQLTNGTGRFWLFHPAHWIHTANHHKVAWQFLDYSPFNP